MSTPLSVNQMCRPSAISLPVLSALVLSALLCAGFSPLVEFGPQAPSGSGEGSGGALSRLVNRELFLLGLEHLTAGNPRRAWPIFSLLVDEYPSLGDYHLLYRMEARRSLGHHTAVIEDASLFEERYPESLLLARALYLKAGAMSSLEDPENAARTIQMAIDANPDTELEGTLLYELAGIRESLGDPQGALALLQAFRRLRPRSRLSPEVRSRIGAIYEEHPELEPARSPETLLAEGDLLRREGAREEAIETYFKLAEEFARSSEAATALLAAARCTLSLKQLDRAVGMFRLVGERYPENPSAPTAAFEMGRALWNPDFLDEAQAVLEELLERYPASKEVDGARYILGRIQEQRGDTAGAAAIYRDLIQHNPRGPFALQAAWGIAWSKYRKADLAGAASDMRALASRTDESHWMAMALYWEARSIEGLGEGRRASARYGTLIDTFPESYYALLARGRLEGLGRRHPVAGDRVQGMIGSGAADPAMTQVNALDWRKAPPEVDYHRTRVEELLSMGIADLATAEAERLWQLRDRFGGTAFQAYVARLYTRSGNHLKAMRITKRLPSGQAAEKDSRRPAQLLELEFPLDYWELITHFCDIEGVDPYLAAGLIRQESVFDRRALSPADARGLMQIIPTTGRQVAEDLGFESFSTEDLYDPETSIRLGVHYIAGLIKAHDGNMVRALAEYNAGPGAVGRWTRRFGDLDDDEYVESITYKETRNYVKLVLRNYAIYRDLYLRPR